MYQTACCYIISHGKEVQIYLYTLNYFIKFDNKCSQRHESVRVRLDMIPRDCPLIWTYACLNANLQSFNGKMASRETMDVVSFSESGLHYLFHILSFSFVSTKWFKIKYQIRIFD